MSMSLTYTRYLELEKLLELQVPRSGDSWDDAEHDEICSSSSTRSTSCGSSRCSTSSTSWPALRRAPPRPSCTSRIRATPEAGADDSQDDGRPGRHPGNHDADLLRLVPRAARGGVGFQSPQFRELEFLLGHRRPGHAEASRRESQRPGGSSAVFRSRPLYQLFLALPAALGLRRARGGARLRARRALVECRRSAPNWCASTARTTA